MVKVTVLSGISVMDIRI